jgi:hypothetical protein
MNKPKVSSVTKWIVNEELSNRFATVYYADIDSDFMKVVGNGHRTQYFYGELAWSDSQRLAGDIMNKELFK